MREAFLFYKSKIKSGTTMGAVVEAVLSIHTAKEARLFFDGYVKDILNSKERSTERFSDRLGSPEAIARSNIGWCFGEAMSDKDRRMWIKTCDAAHPAFGRKMPNPREAFEIGKRMGRRMAKKVWKSGGKKA